MSPGRFKAILRDQLRVSEEQFWETLRTGKAVQRPTELEDAPPEHEPWVLRVLIDELHMSPEELEALSPEEAKRRVHRHWSEAR